MNFKQLYGLHKEEKWDINRNLLLILFNKSKGEKMKILVRCKNCGEVTEFNDIEIYICDCENDAKYEEI